MNRQAKITALQALKKGNKIPFLHLANQSVSLSSLNPDQLKTYMNLGSLFIGPTGPIPETAYRQATRRAIRTTLNI